MITVEERSMLASQEVRRSALQRELVRLDTQIRQEERAQAQLEKRIKLLEQRPRQAA